MSQQLEEGNPYRSDKSKKVAGACTTTRSRNRTRPYPYGGGGKSRVWTRLSVCATWQATWTRLTTSDSTNTFIYGTVNTIPSVSPLYWSKNKGAKAETTKGQVYCTVTLRRRDEAVRNQNRKPES
jgi:hypothetical protein